MQRNWELVRDLLVALEQKPEALSSVWPKHIEGYDPEAVSYHMLLLKEAGLILAECHQSDKKLHCIAASLTWAGHEFLDAIRRDTVWNGVKRTARERGVELSFETIKAVAQKIIEGLLL